jgi:hypothetical protein
MSKFNLETLFPTKNDDKQKFGNGKLDVETLFKNVNLDKKNDSYSKLDADDLLKKVKERRRKLLSSYINAYNNCCNKIKQQNESGKTDTFFNLPEYVIDSPDFVHEDCLNYICKYLRSNHMETYIMNKYTMFVSWHNIEYNKVNYDKKYKD